MMCSLRCNGFMSPTLLVLSRVPLISALFRDVAIGQVPPHHHLTGSCHNSLTRASGVACTRVAAQLCELDLVPHCASFCLSSRTVDFRAASGAGAVVAAVRYSCVRSACVMYVPTLPHSWIQL
jgi:hypothetical protein